MLVSERPGRLRIVSASGELSSPITGLPDIFVRRQAGLLDVAVDNRFTQNRLIYFTYADSGSGGVGTSAARAQLAAGDSMLTNVRRIFEQHPKVAGTGHYGSRIILGPDSTLFITLGDRREFNEEAQNLTTTIGKVVRIRPDGTIPSDNPFIGRSDARPEIWTYGHRNIQAAVMDPESGSLWTVEHGSAGGDELNKLEAGANYGWPVISYGLNYDGSRIGEGAVRTGMQQPKLYWDPVIAPSGMELYTGNRYPGWRGDLIIGSLRLGALVRLEMHGDSVVSEKRYLVGLQDRIRDVAQGPDGYLYVITDKPDGRLLRIVPTP